MIVNLLYAAFRLGAAFHFRSAWFLSLGVFHLVLGLLRANLGLAEKRQELRCYRQTAWLLFFTESFYGRHDRTDGADRIQFFLSWLRYLSFRHVRLLHAFGGSPASGKVSKAGQPSSFCRQGTAFCFCPDDHAGAANGYARPVLSPCRRVSPPDECHYQRFCMGYCDLHCHIYAAAQPKSQKGGTHVALIRKQILSYRRQNG